MVASDEEEYKDVIANLADDGITTLPNVEHEDSTKTDVVDKENDATPNSKSTGKMSFHSAGSNEIVNIEDVDCSVTNPTKV
ncbi:hypothetical protein P8452_00776 [Trifolium repens]|nr:hypothetical protein P8452_00776 [Trifolium repens]